MALGALTSPNGVMDYTPKRPLRPHQQPIYNRSRDMPLFALEMDAQTGKSKIVVDTACYQFTLGAVDALLVVAMPAGVERNWLEEHLPKDCSVPWLGVQWRAAKAGQRGFQAQLADLLAFKGLAVLAVNGEGTITLAFRTWLPKFLRARRVMAVGDETTMIMKTPGAKRTRVMHAIGSRVKWKRILDGTMHGENPLDYYAQYAFLDKAIIGFGSFFAYKARYAVQEPGFNGNTNTEFTKVVGYQNLDELRAKLDPWRAVVKREDISDLPPAEYAPKHYFKLSDEQRRVYDNLRDEYETELQNGETVVAPMVLTRYLRLQQVTSNWWPARGAVQWCLNCDGDGCAACDDLGAVGITLPGLRVDKDHHPRLDALRHQLEMWRGKPVIVAARFTHDVEDVLDAAKHMGLRTGRYDGKASDDEKLLCNRRFQDGLLDLVAAEGRSISRGRTWNAGSAIMNYSNDFSLLRYLQLVARGEADTEKRTRTRGMVIIDLVAEDTVDETIVETLRTKKKLADVVMGRQSGAFL